MFGFNIWSGDNALALVTVFVAFIGGIAALFQWRESSKLRRAEFVRQLMQKLRFDEAVAQAAYLIDYDPHWYTSDENFHNRSDKSVEICIDNYLAYLSYLCYLIDVNIIGDKEIWLFEYKLRRTLASPSIQAYLWNLTHFGEKEGIESSFGILIDYGIKQKIIDKDFLTNNTDKFENRLGF